MSWADAVNGGFELVGSVAIWRNVLALYKDKHYAGIRIGPTAFFFAWGLWNTAWYYPSLTQWWSWAGGISITLANVVWLGQMFYYGNKNKMVLSVPDNKTAGGVHQRPEPDGR